jgi:hypothetical protein
MDPARELYVLHKLQQVLHHEKPHPILLPELLMKTVLIVQTLETKTKEDKKDLVLHYARTFLEQHLPEKEDLIETFDDYAPYLLDVLMTTIEDLALNAVTCCILPAPCRRLFPASCRKGCGRLVSFFKRELKKE